MAEIYTTKFLYYEIKVKTFYSEKHSKSQCSQYIFTVYFTSLILWVLSSPNNKL